MKNAYYFGIDGGGTHSRLAIVNDSGEPLAKVEAGSTNIYSVSKEQVFENLSILLERGLFEASISKADLRAGCIGSAGLRWPGEAAAFRVFFDKLLGNDFPVKLCTDGEILLAGGLGEPEGYCLIAGTGSIALGRSVKGDLFRAGGFGYLLGDEGSASWIGLKAIARTLRSLEKRDLPTDMLPALLKAAGLQHSDELIQFVHHYADKSTIGALSPTVTAAARESDPLALDILNTGAQELALLVKSVVDSSVEIIQRKVLILAGGVIEHNEILARALNNELQKMIPGLSVEKKKGSALDGACLLASCGSK